MSARDDYPWHAAFERFNMPNLDASALDEIDRLRSQVAGLEADLELIRSAGSVSSQEATADRPTFDQVLAEKAAGWREEGRAVSAHEEPAVPAVDLEQHRYDAELHHRLRQLEDAVEVLWGELSIEQVRELRREMPELSDFLVHLHHGVSHEEAMVRRNVWAASLAEETPAEHAESDCPYADHGFCSAPYDRRLRAARSAQEPKP